MTAVTSINGTLQGVDFNANDKGLRLFKTRQEAYNVDLRDGKITEYGATSIVSFSLSSQFGSSAENGKHSECCLCKIDTHVPSFPFIQS